MKHGSKVNENYVCMTALVYRVMFRNCISAQHFNHHRSITSALHRTVTNHRISFFIIVYHNAFPWISIIRTGKNLIQMTNFNPKRSKKRSIQSRRNSGVVKCDKTLNLGGSDCKLNCPPAIALSLGQTEKTVTSEQNLTKNDGEGVKIISSVQLSL